MRIRYSIKYFIKPVLTVLLILLPLNVISQEPTTCAENLNNAQALFMRGQVEQVPDILYDCMKSGFTREEQLTAYKLLIQSYLIEDKLVKADSTMLEFLKKNPEYELSPTDHSSFVNLFNKFNVKPVLQLSIHLGTNLPFITFIVIKTVSPARVENNYSSTALNLYASLETKFELSEKLELNIEPGYSRMKFTNIEIRGSGITTYNESQHRFELPVSFTYDLKRLNRFTLYGRVGLGPAFTLGSTATAESVRIDDNNLDLHSGKTIERNKSRINMDLFTQAGAGVKFKIRGGYLLAEIRSNFGFMNQVVRDGDVIAEKELQYNYSYKDDDFVFNSVNFSLGYTRIFYKPSKRKE